MAWLCSAAFAELTSAIDKTNHTDNGTLPYRINNLAAGLGVDAMIESRRMSRSGIDRAFICLGMGSP